MAIMHPTFPTKDSPLSEIGLFELFRDQLDDSFHVFHSIDYVLSSSRRGKVREGQIDFMILHPSLGILVLEVKGGQEIIYRGDKTEWYSIDHYGREAAIKDPYLQGRWQVHDLMNFLKAVSVPGFDADRMSFGHAAVFPDANPHSGSLPPHAEEWMTIPAKDKERIGERVKLAMERWGKERNTQPLSSRTIEALIDSVFMPVFRMFYSLADKLNDQEKVIWKMTEDQYRLLDYLADRPRALIKGYAGTGKTLLAQEKARRAALAGKNVLLLCYNKPLSEHLTSSIERFKTNITVDTFHGLCRRIMVEGGQEFDARPGDTEFWNDEVPLRMLEALSHSLERYDVIIVDEAQDFSSNWWPVVEELLFSRKSGELYIFFDPLQNIFNRDTQFPVGEAPFSLDRQCRNTRSISEFVAETAGVTIPSYNGQPEGDPVALKPFESESHLMGMLSQTVKDLFMGGVKPRNIAILCPLPLSESPIRGCSELCGFPILESPWPRKSQSIRFSTIGRFKGLEAEIVIVVDAPAQTAADKMRLYVAGSRAKHLLFVFDRKKAT